MYISKGEIEAQCTQRSVRACTMHSSAMQGHMHAMSGTTRQSQLSTGSASHQQRTFRPFKHPTCAASSAAAAAIPAQQGACGPTRRDMMLLGAAMLSYQASYPNVRYCYSSTPLALQISAPFSTNFVPHAAMQMLNSWLEACHTCKGRDANLFTLRRKAKLQGLPAILPIFSPPHSQSLYSFPEKHWTRSLQCS